MKTYLLFPSKKAKWVKMVKEHKAPDHPLYGLTYFSQMGIEGVWSDRGFGKSVWRLPFRLLDQWFLSKTYMGFKLDVILSQLTKLHESKIVVSFSESVGLPLLLCKKIGLVTIPVVFVSIGFDQRFLKKDSILRGFVGSLLQEASRIVVYSQSEREVYNSVFSISDSKSKVTAVGVDVKFLTPKKEEQTIDVLACGRDYGRDFRTVVEAVRGTTLRTVLVCPKEHIRGIILSENIEHREQVDYDHMRELFAKAKVVAVIVHPYKTSGQFGLLEAWAMGKAVVVSNMPSLTTAFMAKDREHYLLAAPNNHVELRTAIESLLSDVRLKARLEKSGRELVENAYTSKGYAYSLGKVIREVVDER